MSDRTDTIKPARIDLGDGDSLNLYRMSDYTTVVRFHGNNPNVQLSSAQVSTVALRAALEEVAPGSYTRHEAPDYADGGVTAAAIEKEAEQGVPFSEHLGKLSIASHQARQAEKDAEQWQERAGAAERMAALWKETTREHVRRVRTAKSLAEMAAKYADDARDRAGKAEEERDELRQTRRRLLGKVDQLEVKLRNSGSSGEQPRALTAREHLDAAWEAAHVPEGETIPKGAWAIQREPTGQILTAYAEHDHVRAREPFAPQMERRLLDPPAPSRPEGAEEISLELDRWDEEWGEANHRLDPEERDALADYLAERGVRVATEEDQ